MSDPIRPLLYWILAHDTYRRVIITGSVDLPRPGHRDLVLVADAQADAGLCAQILALGVPMVEVAWRGDDGEHLLDQWARLTPGLVREYVPHRGLRRGCTLELGRIPLPRRALLGLRATSPIDLTDDSADRTLAALRLLVREGRIPAPDGSASPHPGHALRVDGCTACGVCVRNCPGGALSIVQAAGTSRLRHHARACRACGVCVDSCPQDGVRAGEPFTYEDAWLGRTDVLAEVATRTCHRCGRPFPAQTPPPDGRPICPHCHWRTRTMTGDTTAPCPVPPRIAGRLGQDLVDRLGRTPRL